MRHQVVRLVILTALLGVGATATFDSPGSIAGASTSVAGPLTVTCASLRGGETSQTISGCTGSGAIADDAGSAPAHGKSVSSTQVVTWSNGKISRLNYTWVDRTGQANTCPARNDYSREQQTIEKGKVITPGSTTKAMIGGVVEATLCVYRMAQSPHTVLVVNQGKVSI